MSGTVLGQALKAFVQHLREILKQYPHGTVLSEVDRKLLTTKLEVLIQHYFWLDDKKATKQKKGLYRKLALVFHPDKYDSYSNADSAMLQKEEVARIARLLGHNEIDHNAFFKVLGHVNGEYQSDLPSLDDVLSGNMKKSQPQAQAYHQAKSNSTSSNNTHSRQSYQQYSSSQEYEKNRQYHSGSSYSQSSKQREYQYSKGYRQSGGFYYNRGYQQRWGHQQRRQGDSFHFNHDDVLYNQLKQFLIYKHYNKATIIYEKLTLDTILTKLINEPSSKYLALFLSQFNTSIDDAVMQKLLMHVLQNDKLDMAKVVVKYCKNVEQIYFTALKEMNNQMLFWLHEICDQSYSFQNRSTGMAQMKKYYSDYNIRRLMEYRFIHEYNLPYMTEKDYTVLSNSAICSFILSRHISLSAALALTENEIELINYPGFELLVEKHGDLNYALDLMKKHRAILYQDCIYEFAQKGIQQVRHHYRCTTYHGYRAIPLERLMRLSNNQIENLKNNYIKELIQSGDISFESGINCYPRDCQMLSYACVRETIHREKNYQNNRQSYIFSFLDQVARLPLSELEAIDKYKNTMIFFDLNWFYKHSVEQREKLISFSSIVDKFSYVQRHRNGFSRHGMRPTDIIELSLDQVENYKHPLAEELYHSKGILGKHILHNLPNDFFKANESLSINEFIKEALFYAARNDMTEIFDLYWQHYMPSSQAKATPIFTCQNNLFNLYTMTNQKGLTLSESAEYAGMQHSKERLGYLTYNYDAVYKMADKLSQVVFNTSIANVKKSVTSWFGYSS